MSTRSINVPVLTRVEGEGALHVRIDGDRVSDLRLRIYEPPRFFEVFLQGRLWREVPDITARICGICPVAYQMSASQAIEAAFEVSVPAEIMDLKRLYYCGEWIESHALHIHMLAGPDLFGFSDVISMAAQYPDEVRRGLRLQALGNDIISALGGRPVNPVGALPGGFYRGLSHQEVRDLLGRLREALPAVEELVRWTATVEYPEVHRSGQCVSLRHQHEYPMVSGRIMSSGGLEIDVSEFPEHFNEFQVPHSTALHCLLDGERYWTGPLPRLNNNLDRLPASTERLLHNIEFAFPSDNPYHSTVARAIEMHVAVVEAIRILEHYVQPSTPFVRVEPRAGRGAGASEAPRGLLWHYYEFNDEGYVTKATITPPTSQNQARIEEDMRQTVLESLNMNDDDLRQRLEAGIRNYDPCISCSTHFLKLTVERN